MASKNKKPNKKPSKKPNFIKRHKVLTAVIAVLLVLIAAASWFVLDKFGRLDFSDGKPDTTLSPDEVDDSEGEIDYDEFADLKTVDGAPEIPDMPIHTDKDVINILLIGTDERTKKFSDNARSDSMMILSVNKKENTMKLVSLERAIGVPVLEGDYKGQFDWLTHMFAYGGADLLMKEIKTCFRVDLDRYVRVNFSTLAQIVDSMGGLDIYLTSAEAEHFRSQGYSGIRSGTNHLTGRQVVFYSRIRVIDSDWGRVKRQRNVIEAAVKSGKDLSVMELNSLLNDVLPLVQTNLTRTEIASLMLEVPGLMGKSIDQMTLPAAGTFGSMQGMGGRSVLAVDFTENAEILKEFLYE